MYCVFFPCWGCCVVRGLGELVGFGLMDCDVGVLGVIVLLWGVMEVVLLAFLRCVSISFFISVLIVSFVGIFMRVRSEGFEMALTVGRTSNIQLSQRLCIRV